MFCLKMVTGYTRHYESSKLQHANVCMGAVSLAFSDADHLEIGCRSGIAPRSLGYEPSVVTRPLTCNLKLAPKRGVEPRSTG